MTQLLLVAFLMQPLERAMVSAGRMPVGGAVLAAGCIKQLHGLRQGGRLCLGDTVDGCDIRFSHRESVGIISHLGIESGTRNSERMDFATVHSMHPYKLDSFRGSAYECTWMWLKIKLRGYARFGPCFHSPGFDRGTGFLSRGDLLSRIIGSSLSAP